MTKCTLSPRHKNTMEQRSNMKFCFTLGKTRTETFELMTKFCGDDCLSHTHGFQWYNGFQDSHDVLRDDWIQNCCCECLTKKQTCVLQYPSYSRDLSPCDYFLFPKLKLIIKGTFHDNIKQVQEAMTRPIEAIPKNLC